jgi:tetrapyrrole methylase family protein/MazG family protein
MFINDMQEVITFLGIDQNHPLFIAEIKHFSHANRIFPQLDSHTLIRVDFEEPSISHILAGYEASLVNFHGVSWLCKVTETWRRYPTLEKVQQEVLKDCRPLYLYIPPQPNKISADRFVELIAHLRSPEGCPWDQKQTHRSLRTNLLEETYEVLAAIDEDDEVHLQEELGDLLLQVVLHAQIANDQKAFDFGNVVHDIYWKLRTRHPHVFSDTKINSEKDVLTNWEIIKAEERTHKNDKDQQSILSSIPDALPALSIAQKYQERAARVGFDWEEITPVYEKVFEEIGEVREASADNGLEEELGDLLFAVVNLVRWSGFDAETALRMTNQKFRRRFQFIEKTISDNGRSISDVPLSEMDALWEEAKLNEH